MTRLDNCLEMEEGDDSKISVLRQQRGWQFLLQRRPQEEEEEEEEGKDQDREHTAGTVRA